MLCIFYKTQFPCVPSHRESCLGFSGPSQRYIWFLLSRSESRCLLLSEDTMSRVCSQKEKGLHYLAGMFAAFSVWGLGACTSPKQSNDILLPNLRIAGAHDSRRVVEVTHIVNAKTVIKAIC